jgi:hypothetical protein
VRITPASLSFGGQQVGSISGARSYRVANEGSADLVAGGVALTGRHPADFRASTGCARAPVPPGGTCTVSVRFVPRFTGLRTAAAVLTDSAPRAPQGVAVSGFGGGPDAFVPVGPMATPRDHATATLLPDGDVLVAGTFSGQVTIPAAKPGRYPVDAVGARSGRTGNGGFTTFTVTG